MSVSKYPIHYSGVYDNSELDKIIETGEQADLIEAKVEIRGEEVVNRKKRDTTISWIHPTEDNLWIFSKASKVLSTAAISTLQTFQYSVYYLGGHYEWHRDTGGSAFLGKARDAISNRVIAGSLQLSEPEDYKGGILKLKTPEGILSVEKERGMVTVFPAGWEHTVTPVTDGIRRTLVMWGLK